jgi:energy-coupling factor transport system permease protein
LNSKFIFGQYKPSSSFVHNLDPRGKITVSLLIMVAALASTSIVFYLVTLLMVIVLLKLSGISFMTIVRNGRPFIYLVLITAAYHIVFSGKGTDIIIELAGFKIYYGGLYLALVFSLRVLVFIGLAFMISLTIAPSDMAETIVYFLRPLKVFRVPVEDIGLVLFIAMRFVPVLAQEFDTIKKAQIIRGVDFSGNLIKRGRSLLYLFIPVFYSSIRRADDLALAIESRGYVSGQRRTSFGRFQWRLADTVFLLSVFILMAVTLSIWG